MTDTQVVEKLNIIISEMLILNLTFIVAVSNWPAKRPALELPGLTSVLEKTPIGPYCGRKLSTSELVLNVTV